MSIENMFGDLDKIDILAEKPETKEVLMVLVCNGFIDGSPETQKALLDKMEGYLNHTQSEEFQKEYGGWSVILRVTLGREPDERILALLSKCPAWAEDYGVKLEFEIGGKPGSHCRELTDAQIESTGGNYHADHRMAEQIRIHQGQTGLQNGPGRLFYRKSDWEHGRGCAGHRRRPLPYRNHLRLRSAGGAGGHAALYPDDSRRDLSGEDLRGAQ